MDKIISINMTKIEEDFQYALDSLCISYEREKKFYEFESLIRLIHKYKVSEYIDT